MCKKSLLMMLLFALFAPWAANAQTTVEIGDGTVTSNTNPIGTYYNYSIAEQLYTADEIGTAGTISSISFYYMGIAARDLPITVYMKHVDEVDLASGGITLADADEVFSGTLPVTTTAGWVTIDLATPFVYDGSSNLLIGFIKDYLYYFSGQSWQGTATTATMARYTQNDYNAYTTSTVPGTAQANRPNIQIEITPTGGGPVCEKPETMEASDVTATSATLTWTGGSGTYNVEYKGGSVEDWTAYLTNTTATTANLTNLAPATTYSYRVQSVCGEDVSGWKSVSFMTQFGIPLVEEFGTTIPTGWAQYTGLMGGVLADTIELTAATYGWSFGTNNGVFDDHARVNIYGTSCQRWLVMPTINMENNVQLMFDVAYTAYSGTGAPAQNGTDDKFVVLINNGGNWEILRQWDNAGSEYVLNDLNTTPLTVVIDLSSYAGNNIAIAFYGESTESNADNNLHIDNVSIDYIPACPKPLALAVNYEGNTSAMVTWESDAAGFEIDCNGTQITGITGNSYELTGLELATEYEVKVRANCGTDGFSEWTDPVSFTTNICLDENMCVLYFVTIDSYGDGWNGAYIQVTDVETGIVLAQITNTNAAAAGEQQIWALNVCDGREIQFTWNIGGYDSECTYGVFDLNEDLLFSGTGSMAEPFNWTVSCLVTPCRKPSTPVASEVGPRSAKLSWTEYGPATEWVVAYKASGAEEFTEVTTTENPYTLTGLEPDTTYIVKVLPVCEVDKWSDEGTFYTLAPCPVPTNMNVTHVTATTATLNWEGWGSQYNVRYAAVTHGTVLAQQDFENGMGEWTTIDADEDGYTWDLMSVWNFNGTPHGGSDMITSMSYYSGTVLYPDNYLVSPQVALGGTISFWAAAQDASYPSEHFGVAVSTTGNTDAADFTTIWETTMTAKGGNDRGDANAARFVIDGVRTNPATTRSGNRTMGTWYHYTIDLSDYAGQTGYVALRHFNCSDMFYLDVDDIVIETAAPDMQWFELTTTDNSLDLTGLEAETEYMWQVQANCGDDGMGEWTLLATFTTGTFCDTPFDLETTDVTYNAATLNWYGSQDSYNVRYRTTEVTDEYYFTNFNTNADREGWIWEGSIIYGFDDPIYGYASDVNYFLQMGWATTNETYIFSPELPEYAEGSLLEFYYFGYNVANTFQVGYSSTTADTTAFTWSEPIDAPLSQYTLFSEVLPAGTKYVAYKATAESQGACIFIDNFRVYSVVTPAGEWIEATANESTLAISGLTPETEYEWQVQGINPDCDSITGTTEWSEIATFTTLEQTTVTQTIALSSDAVNYCSFYVDITLADLQTALTDVLGTGSSVSITIKSQTQNCKLTRGRWTGQLTTLELEKMYLISVNSDCEITLEGMLVDPADHPITISGGGLPTWIAFPFNAEMTLTNAFAGFAVNGDVAKSRLQNANFTRGRWTGQLQTLEPGQGYIYKSASNAVDRVFVYPTNNKK